MKNEKITKAYDLIEPSDESRQRVFEKIKDRKPRKKPVSRYAVSFAAAAAVMFCAVFGIYFLGSGENGGMNMFALRSYAMEQRRDGSVELREINLLDNPRGLAFFHDGEYLYINIGLGIRIEGENIRSMKLIADDCEFFSQRIGQSSSERGATMIFGETIVKYGFEFDRIGSVLILDENTMTDDLLLFIAQPMVRFNNAFSMTFRVVVSFDNGEEQSRSIMITGEHLGGGSRQSTPEERAEQERELDERREHEAGIPTTLTPADYDVDRSPPEGTPIPTERQTGSISNIPDADIEMYKRALNTGISRTEVEALLGSPSQRVSAVYDGRPVYRFDLLKAAGYEYRSELDSDTVDIDALLAGRVRLIIFVTYANDNSLENYSMFYLGENKEIMIHRSWDAAIVDR